MQLTGVKAGHTGLQSSHRHSFDLLRRDLLTLTPKLDTLLSLGTPYTKVLEDEDPLIET